MTATGYVGHDPTLVPKTTQVIAGSGLSGGGPLSTDITLDNTGGGGGGVPSGRLISTTPPLTGGGDLSQDRTLAISGSTTFARGAVRLAGDLAGTADAPTVPGLAGKAADTAVVHNTGAENVNGVKTFLDGIVIPGASLPESAILNLVSDLNALSTAIAARVLATRLISTTAPLVGGGDLQADRTLSVADATTLARGVIQLAGDLAGTATAPVIANGAVTSAKIADGTIVAADISATAAILKSQLASLGIVDADVNAISESKITNLVSDLASKQPLDAGLTSLAALASTGLVAGTAADTYTQRSIVAGSGKLVVTNGSGVAGNPSIDIGTLTAGDIPVLDAAKITSGVLNGNRLPDPIQVPNLISGAWYFVPSQGGVGTVTPANQTAYFLCLVPLRDCTLTGMAIEITTQDSTGTIRFGLATGTAGLPATFSNDFGTAVATATGIVQPGSTPNVALTAGTPIWLIICPQGLTSGLVLRNRATCDANIPGTPTSTASPGVLNTVRNCFTATGISGAFGTGAVTVAAVGSAPVVEVRLT